jgi:hypothetical protein
VRVALISLTGQPKAADGAPVTIAGRSLAVHQAHLALAAGATGVVALGDGASLEAVALRHAVERQGARYQTIRDSHGLLGLVRTTDELLVLAPALLAQAPEARVGTLRGDHPNRRYGCVGNLPSASVGKRQTSATRAHHLAAPIDTP